MTTKTKIWCDTDEHNRFEYFNDFNEWLDSEEGLGLCEANGIGGLSQRSKAFYAGDRQAYDQAFEVCRNERRNETLCKNCLCELCADDHWFQRNQYRFDQLVDCLIDGNVVPFLGAGFSVAGGFPTWKVHLRQQGRTAGIEPLYIESLLSNGQYEDVIQEIENTRGRDVFMRTSSITRGKGTMSF